jgi:hypothetical protein
MDMFVGGWLRFEGLWAVLTENAAILLVNLRVIH